MPELPDTLTISQHRELNLALMRAFPTNADLVRMVRLYLGEASEAIVGNGTLVDLTFRLIEWAEAYGRVKDLIQAALAANSGNPWLQNFIAQFQLPTNLALPSISGKAAPFVAAFPFALAEHYRALKDAYLAQEWQRVQDLAIGIEDYRDVLHLITGLTRSAIGVSTEHLGSNIQTTTERYLAEELERV